MKLATSFFLLLLACSPEQVGCELRDSSGSAEEGQGGGASALPAVTPRADGEVIEHTLSFPAPDRHFIEVETVFEAEGVGWYENLGHAARLLDVVRLYAALDAVEEAA